MRGEKNSVDVDFLHGQVVKYIKKERYMMETDKSKIYADVMKIVDTMDGHKFEYFCAKLLEQCEFRDVVVTRGSGDYGVDITARYHNRKYAIQCKRHSRNVNLKAVQEAGMGGEYYQCDVAVVLCNGFFAKSAINMAEQTGVRLWDRNYLLDLISQCENLDFVNEFVKKENTEDTGTVLANTKGKKNKKVVQQKSKSKSRKSEKSKRSTSKWLIAIIVVLLAYIANTDDLQNNSVESKDEAIDIIENVGDEQEVEDTSSGNQFLLVNLFEENHPYFLCSVEEAEKWISKYNDYILFDGKYKEYSENVIVCLNSGFGEKEELITDIEIDVDKIEKFDLNAIPIIIKEYLPMEKIETYYDLEESFSISYKETPEEINSYFVVWKIKDEYDSLDDKNEFSGIDNITLSVRNDVITIDNDGVCSSNRRFERNGFIINDWDAGWIYE